MNTKKFGFQLLPPLQTRFIGFLLLQVCELAGIGGKAQEWTIDWDRKARRRATVDNRADRNWKIERS